MSAACSTGYIRRPAFSMDSSISDSLFAFLESASLAWILLSQVSERKYRKSYLPSRHPSKLTHRSNTVQYPCKFSMTLILNFGSGLRALDKKQVGLTSSWWKMIDLLGSIPTARIVASISHREADSSFAFWGNVKACQPTIEKMSLSSSPASFWSCTQFERAPK